MADSLFEDDTPDEFMGPDPVGLPEDPVAQVADEAPPDDAEMAEAVAAAEPDMFPREYVENLRREAAEYRTRARAYEQKFDGYTEDEREALLDYIHLTRRAEAGDPEAAAALQELFGADEDDAPPEAPQWDEESFRRLAREEAERLVAERQAHEQQVKAVETVQSRAQELGYTPGSEDYILLLKYANEVEEGDPITQGHEKVQAYKQAIIQQHLATIQQQNETISDLPSTNGAAPSAAQQPRTFAEARNAMHERLMRASG